MSKILKQVKFDIPARESLLKGMEVVYKAVSSTLGPRGRNVAFDNVPDYDLAPTVLRDGVSVARAINLEDEFEDMGARLLKTAALKTVGDVGDGTTLTTILAYNIVIEANKAITAGVNPMKIKAEIESAGTSILAELKKTAKTIAKKEEIAQVASISASDKDLGNLVAEAIDKVGNDGIITVEEGSKAETTVDYKEGIEIQRGYYSPHFITDAGRGEAVIEKPYVLLTDRKLSTGYEVLPFLDKLAKEGIKDLVVITGEAVEEALATFTINKLRGLFNLVVVQAPAFGNRRVDELQDIASLIGGDPLLIDEGAELKDFDISRLGRADKVIVNREKTIILGGNGDEDRLHRRVKDLQSQIKNPTSPYDKDVLEERLANLTGAVAIINVGGSTEVEVKEKKERVIDAVAATKAAIEEGIVAGGEITLLKLASILPSKETSVGQTTLVSALKSPFKVLMENAGMDYAEALQKLADKPYPFGIDVIDGETKDLIKSGIIDPLKVVRCAVENAISVACMVLTTNTLITSVAREK